MKILVVEDQKDISDIVAKYLEKEGYEVECVYDGLSALDYIASDTFHLIILDIMLPFIDGFQILEEIRKFSNTPVIMLTARELEVDRLKGFDLGADDYVVKPFSPRELVKRVKVIFRRLYNESNESIIEYKELKLYLKSMKLVKNDEEVDLTTTEFNLLKVFMENRGIILNRDQIIALSFGNDYEGFDRNIDSYIRRIRKKIEDDPANPKYLVTKYGAGYMFGGENDEH
ncbi:response regulator transcription factor [Soehngenia longivitae]|uniref:Response regulator transcription factor n=1 Tax=Soehngenia longivitae TaxID=2562294 RepID=A0A4Z0D8T1_9FIRM|nr:response regulator transcription factor [Soehngenia longivitae]TFZ41331.1 response regulator transcription factor [Soehngenia longivitae]